MILSEAPTRFLELEVLEGNDGWLKASRIKTLVNIKFITNVRRHRETSELCMLTISTGEMLFVCKSYDELIKEIKDANS